MNRTIAVVAALALLAPAAAQAKLQSQLGIQLQSCVVNSNGSGQTNGINVVYYNGNESNASEVDFQVTYHGKKQIFSDHGNFSRGAQINHNLTNGLVGFPWNGPKPKKCSVERVVLADGQVLTL